MQKENRRLLPVADKPMTKKGHGPRTEFEAKNLAPLVSKKMRAEFNQTLTRGNVPNYRGFTFQTEE